MNMWQHVEILSTEIIYLNVMLLTERYIITRKVTGK